MRAVLDGNESLVTDKELVAEILSKEFRSVFVGVDHLPAFVQDLCPRIIVNRTNFTLFNKTDPIRKLVS